MLGDQISTLYSRYERQRESIETEEATKNALVMPFISALGYDVFDPSEVVPEVTADVGTKKGEKVDYGLYVNGVLSILIECKSCHTKLDYTHASQLFRYFSATDARFAILTNGIEYRFYSDLDKENRMDESPFFTFNAADYDDAALRELERFKKDQYDTDDILGKASDLKYLNLLRSYLKEQFESPSEDFVRYLGKQVFPGKMTQSVFEMFQGVTKRAIDQTLKLHMRARFRDVLDDEVQTHDDFEENTQEPNQKHDIETTDEELLGFQIVQAIGAEITDPKRIYIRDAKSYCAVLFDDNNRKPLVRLHFGAQKKKVSFFDSEEQEFCDIDAVIDLYSHKKRILDAIRRYL